MKLILMAILALGLVGTINAQESDEQEEVKDSHPRFSIEGILETGYFRDSVGRDGDEGHFTAGDSKIKVTGELNNRIRAHVRARLKHLDIYDNPHSQYLPQINETIARDHAGEKKDDDVKIGELIDLAEVEITLDESGEFALVIGKLSVPAGLAMEEGLFFAENRMRKHNLMDGYMGFTIRLEGDGLMAAKQLVDKVEITGFETQNGDFKFGSDVEGSKIGFGGSIRVTKDLNEALTAKITQIVMKDRDIDAKAYRTSVGLIGRGSVGSRSFEAWTEGIVSRNYDPRTGEISVENVEANDTYGITAGVDAKVLNNIFVTMEGTHLKDEISEVVASVRYEHNSGISAGIETRAKQLRGEYSLTAEERVDFQVGGLIRADLSKLNDFVRR